MRSVVTGLINSAIRNKSIDEDKLEFNVFDYLTLEEFTSFICTKTYLVRRFTAAVCVNSLSLPQLTLAKQYAVSHQGELEVLYAALVEQGYEGLIIKHTESQYTFKRSAEWIKLKETKTADIQCVDIVEGQGKYIDEIGALHCEGIVEGKNIQVKVGSGLADIDRAEEYTYFLGKTIEIKYNSITKDSRTGQYSLFLPRFVCVREDK